MGRNPVHSWFSKRQFHLIHLIDCRRWFNVYHWRCFLQTPREKVLSFHLAYMYQYRKYLPFYSDYLSYLTSSILSWFYFFIYNHIIIWRSRIFKNSSHMSFIYSFLIKCKRINYVLFGLTERKVKEIIWKNETKKRQLYVHYA